MQFGQGLSLSRGLGFGKGADAVRTVKQPGIGIRPYASVNENQFQRGAAATYAIGKSAPHRLWLKSSTRWLDPTS